MIEVLLWSAWIGTIVLLLAHIEHRGNKYDPDN